VSAVETERDRRIAETKVKWLTGGDRLKARFMRADFFEFVPTHKFWLLGNHRPEVVGTDTAIWRRICLLPFRVDLAERLGPDALVRDFAGTLTDELPGILAWFVRGAVDWYANGLRPPASVKNATAAYREEQDHVGEWFAECCERDPRARTPFRTLFDSYQAALRSDAISKRAFALELSRLGIPDEKVGGVKFRMGARLRGESCDAS
jgi:putative DNA primase/helicase